MPLLLPDRNAHLGFPTMTSSFYFCQIRLRIILDEMIMKIIDLFKHISFQPALRHRQFLAASFFSYNPTFFAFHRCVAFCIIIIIRFLLRCVQFTSSTSHQHNNPDWLFALPYHSLLIFSIDLISIWRFYIDIYSLLLGSKFFISSLFSLVSDLNIDFGQAFKHFLLLFISYI